MKFKADTEVAELTRAKEQLLSLKDKVPGIINITFGHTFTHDRAQVKRLDSCILGFTVYGVEMALPIENGAVSTELFAHRAAFASAPSVRRLFCSFARGLFSKKRAPS